MGKFVLNLLESLNERKPFKELYAQILRRDLNRPGVKLDLTGLSPEEINALAFLGQEKFIEDFYDKV